MAWPLGWPRSRVRHRRPWPGVANVWGAAALLPCPRPLGGLRAGSACPRRVSVPGARGWRHAPVRQHPHRRTDEVVPSGPWLLIAARRNPRLHRRPIHKNPAGSRRRIVSPAEPTGEPVLGYLSQAAKLLIFNRGLSAGLQGWPESYIIWAWSSWRWVSPGGRPPTRAAVRHSRVPSTSDSRSNRARRLPARLTRSPDEPPTEHLTAAEPCPGLRCQVRADPVPDPPPGEGFPRVAGTDLGGRRAPTKRLAAEPPG